MSLYKNKTNSEWKKRIIILLCVVILILIPVTLWIFVIGKVNGFTKYQGNSYSFYYPNTWTVTNSPLQRVPGTELYLQPVDGGPPETPHVTIEIASDNPNSVSNLIDPFIVFKYLKSYSTIQGIRAAKFTTIVAASEGVLHSTAYVVENNGTIYVIGLSYKKQSADTTLETEFSQLLDTFTFH